MSKSDDAIYQAVLQAAIDALPSAYAPYSQFQVGAAILDDKGEIHQGVNVENAAYPQGSCAEAGAIAAMVMKGGQTIRHIAVAGRGDVLCTPCGGCRQRIREFANIDTIISVCDEAGLRKSYAIADLLPDSFGPDNLA